MENFQVLPIGKLFESPLNPRRSYDSKKMAELVESICSKGILTPIIVRPNNGRFEIGAGHRRYRAALKLNLSEMPAIVREMSDSDFLELLTIENLQREDIRPLDEAQGYRTLMEKTNHDVAAIALKVGKSESYIYQRIKLLELVPEAQKQLAEEKITAGHAILIARLQPEQQKECLEAIEEEREYGEGMSVRDLADRIETEIHLDLNSASFSKKDPDLVPEAGACTTCQKRTGFVPQLFPDIKKKDICTHPDCFHKKTAAFTAKWIAQKSQDSDVPPLRITRESNFRMQKPPDDPEKPVPANLWTEISNVKKDSCPLAREAIVSEGRGQGQVMTICADPKCKKHHAPHYPPPSTAYDKKWRAQEKARKEKREIEKAVRSKIFETVMGKVTRDLSKEDLLLIAYEIVETNDDACEHVCLRHGLNPGKFQWGGKDWIKPIKTHLETLKDKSAVSTLTLEMVLAQYVDDAYARAWRGGDPLLETAKRYRVDPKKIEVQVKAEIKQKKAQENTDPDLPCLNCANDSDHGGTCHRENFYTDDDGQYQCGERKTVQTSAKSKRAAKK